MAHRKNPASGESMLVLLGVAVAGYFAYINNMFAGLGLPYSTTTVPTPSSGTAAGALQQGSTSGGSSSTTAAQVAGAPSLGTPVSTAANAQLQAAANYPYIIPTGAIASSSPPPGYQLLNTQDQGNIWVTTAVQNAVSTYLSGLTATANAACSAWTVSGQPLSTCPALVASNPIMTTTLLKQIISQSGVSGLGFVRAQSVFPYNPISGGMGILNAPSWN
jgi:hypothetical protein